MYARNNLDFSYCGTISATATLNECHIFLAHCTQELQHQTDQTQQALFVKTNVTYWCFTYSQTYYVTAHINDDKAEYTPQQLCQLDSEPENDISGLL